jgi:tetratricopeptide (TPR) repeat protein
MAADGLLVLGKVCTALGLYADAEEHLMLSASVHDKIFGPGKLNLGSLLVHKAVAFNHLGVCQIDAALDSCSLCMNIFFAIREAQIASEEALGAAAMSLLHLRAQILREAECLEDSRVLYELAIVQCREVYGDRSSYYVILLGELADCLRRQRKFQLAEVALEESLKLRREILGKGHFLVGELERSVALLLLDMGCPDLALDRMVSAVAIMGSGLDTAERGDMCHPDIMFNRGIEGLCTRSKLASDDAANVKNREAVLQAQSLIDDALDFFDTYPQGKYSDLHPYILRLGGFASRIPSTLPIARLGDNSLYTCLVRGEASSPDSPEKTSLPYVD